EEAGTLFAIACGRYSRDGGSNLDVFLKAYDGGQIDTGRMSRASVECSNPALSIVVTPQPIVLEQLRLTQATADLCTGYFDLQDLGEFNVKGNTGNVHVHQLTSVGALRTRFEVSRARGLSHFVGRTDEMEILEKALERARRGEGQVVGVVAHAGVG